ncbi:MAG: biopolymer transporter ExbD [Nitrospinota bacterium]|nr:biopolymer transporter ExbD [Nitrospinota bacterium]
MSFHRRFKRSHPVMSDINVTPFVDVMLVLLIIFMVTAPLAMHGMEIKLPKVDSNSIIKEEKYSIAVYRNRQIYFNDKLISLVDLGKELKDIVGLNPSVDVFLKADEALPYGYVVKVMATVRRAGVVNLGMITEPLTVTR